MRIACPHFDAFCLSRLKTAAIDAKYQEVRIIRQKQSEDDLCSAVIQYLHEGICYDCENTPQWLKEIFTLPSSLTV